MSDIAQRLAAPFDPAIISWRVGSVSVEKKRGMALAYIDARDVMRRLDEVCGPEGWQDEYPWSDGKRVVCRIGVKILTSDPANPARQYEWVWKTDGAGDTDYEGEKGALSDAFKRAAVKWGVGRYLYDVAAPWVAVEQRGKTWIIADGEESKLAARLPRPAQAPQTPAGEPTAAPPSSPPANGHAASAARAGLPAANPEEPPEVDESREDMKRLLRVFRAAPTPETIEDKVSGIWVVNAAAIARIKKHGGDAAFALLSDTAQKRLNELRASA